MYVFKFPLTSNIGEGALNRLMRNYRFFLPRIPTAFQNNHFNACIENLDFCCAWKEIFKA